MEGVKAMRLIRQRGQSVTEYAIVFSVVAAAIIGMQIFLKRGLQAKEKGVADYYTRVGGAVPNFTGGGATATRDINNTAQYEPYYANASVTTRQESNVTESRQQFGQINRTGMTSKASRLTGGFQEQTTAQGADTGWNGSAP